jgi:hypothetical protein
MSAHAAGGASSAHKEPSQSTPTKYFVIRTSDGKWDIFQEGHKRPLQSIRNKVLAIETVKLIARYNAPSQVMIERPDGSIHLRYTYTSDQGPG